MHTQERLLICTMHVNIMCFVQDIERCIIKLHKKIDKDIRSLAYNCEERGLLLEVLVYWDQSE